MRKWKDWTNCHCWSFSQPTFTAKRVRNILGCTWQMINNKSETKMGTSFKVFYFKVISQFTFRRKNRFKRNNMQKICSIFRFFFFCYIHRHSFARTCHALTWCQQRKAKCKLLAANLNLVRN